MTNTSPTSTPRPASDARESKARRVQTPPPVLASEVLREDVAPLHPWDGAFRLWSVVFGLLIGASSAVEHAGVLVRPAGGPWLGYALAAVLIGLGAFRVPYTARGTGFLLLGMAAVVTGLVGFGPLDGLVMAGRSPVEPAAKVMAATALPAALLFRARYRAYAGARVALLVALVAAVPAAVSAGMSVAAGPLVASIAAGVTLVAILTSLMGFMGEGTTAASTAWAVCVLVVFGAEVVVRSLWLPSGLGSFQLDARVGAMLMIVCTLTSTGLFQLLARAFAADARRVDVLRKRQPSIDRIDAAD